MLSGRGQPRVLISSIMAEETGLEEQLRAHSAHFSSMVELIPAKFYVTQDEDAAKDSKYWVNKKKINTSKKSVKEVTKKAKRLKLDPESHKSVAELQAEANQRKEEDEAGESGTQAPPKAPPTGAPNQTSASVNGFSVEHVQSTSLSNLQERLREKIESLRRKRKAPDDGGEGGGASTAKCEELAQKRHKRTEKCQRKKELRKKKLVSSSASQDKKRPEPVKPSFVDKETGRVVFSKFDFTTPVKPEEKEKKTNKKAPSRSRDYKKLLAKAEAAQKKLEELKKQDERRGEELEKKIKWQRALDMARGVKLQDNPKLLKKTAKRLEKKKQKSAKAWEERKDSERQARERRQEKRKKNIQERKDQVKAAKIKRRAKKGSRKPGF